MKVTRGSVSKRAWVYDGRKRSTWAYSFKVDGVQQRRQGFLSQAEAQEALDVARAAILSPQPVVVPATPGMTFGEACARYLKAKARKRSLKEDQRIAKHLRAELGEQTPLVEITASRVSQYKAKLLAIQRSRRGGPLSAASVNRPLALLRHLLPLAHEEREVLPAVPRIKLEKEPQGRIRWLEPDEEHRLLAACAQSQNTSLLAIVTVALETGLRKGELLGLTWDRVDLSRGVIRLEVTKSGRRREVPMRQAVYDVLAGLPGPHEGRVWPAGDIRSAFETAVAEARVENFTLHSARHHFASWFVMRGGSIVALQEILGHASLTMTRRYANLSAGHLRAEIAKTEPDERKSSRTVGAVDRFEVVASELPRKTPS
jgi:integrase